MSESRRVLVSGANGGIGRAICETLLGGGHGVIGASRFLTGPSPPAGLERFEIDFSDLDGLPDRLKQLAAGFPDITDLVCCVGKGRFAGLEEFSFAQIRELMDLNFTSQAYLIRMFLPMLKRRSHSRLIIIGSEAAVSGGAHGAIYCASKFALRGFAQSLREECAKSGVHVSLINPGMVRTGFFDRLDFRPGDDDSNYILAEDIAAMVGLIMSSRPGTVFDEVEMSPLKHVIRFGDDKGPL